MYIFENINDIQNFIYSKKHDNKRNYTNLSSDKFEK